MISELLLLKVMTFFLSFVLILLLNENEEITIINYYRILFVYFGVFGVSFQQYFTIK